ncbi:MAG: YihY family inner membrane protein [Proteobacteria bacterium]|nr:YihY family inner membrane protein [Pseudomonadota bacterium]
MTDYQRFKDNSKYFTQELFRRYIKDEVPLAAGSLAYTSLLALVPLMAVLVTVFSAMPLFEDASQMLQDFIFKNFVPTSGEILQSHILGFVEKVRSLTATMFLAVFVTSLLLMQTMEKALNRIFASQPSGRFMKKLLMYWAVLTMGPLLVGGGIAMSSSVLQYSAFAGAKTFLLKVLPVMASTVGFFLIYLVVPNAKIKWRHALAGAIFAAILFELAKIGFTFYVAKIPTYEKVYGALATVPLFLIWLYLSWNIILLGGTMTATLSSSKWRVRTRNYRTEQRFVLLLAVLKMLRQAHIKGETLNYQTMADQLSFVPDNELAAQLAWLIDEHIISLDNEGEYLLQRDLSRLSGREFYKKGAFKIPLEADAYFADFQSLLDEFWQPKDNLLSQSMDSILEQSEQ